MTKVEPVFGVHGNRLWRTLTYLMNGRSENSGPVGEPIGNVRVGDRVLVGDRLVSLTDEMVDALTTGGRLIPLRSSGSVLVVPPGVRSLVDECVTRAVEGFEGMQGVPPENVDEFFRVFADKVDSDDSFAPVLEANRDDVRLARERGRATGRLEITPKMRADMAAGLRMWAVLDFERLGTLSRVDHDGWTVESWRAPLGVVAFVFEGRPNVFADATGVLKSGNSVVFRIGSDALGTARSIRDHLLVPALDASGLPRGAVNLVDSPEHAAGWALFDDSRLSLAVARGSGSAVDQLGQIARQCGTPVSLHGTGGAWLVVGSRFSRDRLVSCIVNSLDRKVCNTLNTLVVLEENKEAALSAVGESLRIVAKRHGSIVVHCPDTVGASIDPHGSLDLRTEAVDPGSEWEWDTTPEITLFVARSVGDAVSSFNRHSPRFVLSVVSDDDDEITMAWENSESPFFGDGFTRWVDGQFALERPELGLANWQHGRLLGRGGVLSGDGVHSVRLRVSQSDPQLHR